MLKKIAIGFGILFVLFVIVIDVTLTALKRSSEKKPNQTQTQNQSTQEQKVVFDIPVLIGKNIDKVKAVLGASADKEPSDVESGAINEWSLTFEKDGKSLLVTYEISTKRVKDFFISTDDLSGKTQDKKHLLELGNLKEGDSRYKIEFVKALADPIYFTGVKIIPAE